MNILTDRLPVAIRIEDTVYDIDSNFRTCLLIIRAFEDNLITWIEKQAILLSNLYITAPKQEHVEQAILKGTKFLDKSIGSTSVSGSSDSAKYYSFTKDADLILAAFQQTHGLDLQNIPYLHWWHFLSLFLDLGSETMFCNLISLRKRLKTNTATKEEKEMAREIEDLIQVEQIDMRTTAEKEYEFNILATIAQARSAKKNMEKSTDG